MVKEVGASFVDEAWNLLCSKAASAVGADAEEASIDLLGQGYLARRQREAELAPTPDPQDLAAVLQTLAALDRPETVEQLFWIIVEALEAFEEDWARAPNWAALRLMVWSALSTTGYVHSAARWRISGSAAATRGRRRRSWARSRGAESGSRPCFPSMGRRPLDAQAREIAQVLTLKALA